MTWSFFFGIGVPIGTDVFVQNFVAKTCRSIIDDVEKLDAIQDGFIHYHLLRFCQDTRLQYMNSHILLGNRSVNSVRMLPEGQLRKRGIVLEDIHVLETL